MTKRFGKYVAIPDGYDVTTCIGTCAVLDRTTDQPVVSGLTPDDATQLARDWNRSESEDA